MVVVSALIAACVSGVALLLHPDRTPSIEFTLVSPPKPEPGNAVFRVSVPGSPDEMVVTQSCYRAHFKIMNLGPGSIVFPYRGTFSLEIQQTNSTEWSSANQWSLGYLPPPLRKGASETNSVRIPADASRWRITTTYRRYQLPVQVLNWITRDLFRTGFEIGDRKDHDAVSTIWEMPRTPESKE
jgi:hypothetical protein